MMLRVIPEPDRATELIRALRLQMGRTKVQPGCLDCQICQDVQDPHVVIYQEQWRSWPDIEKHIGSERFASILELMELSSDAPDLQFCDIHETRGMEFVRKVRKG